MACVNVSEYHPFGDFSLEEVESGFYVSKTGVKVWHVDCEYYFLEYVTNKELVNYPWDLWSLPKQLGGLISPPKKVR